VIVEVKVNKEGKVVSVRYVSGQAVFTDAAADAVRQWKFKPATLNGQAIEQTTQIKVDFRPS
jgi:TonB family protein